MSHNKFYKIPKKIHQIWIGSKKIPVYHAILKKSINLYASDFTYRLWRNEDITKNNFPITFEYIHRASEVGKELYGVNNEMWNGTPTKKLAQIADLMRLEIMYHHGGFYLDLKIELLAPLISMIQAKTEFLGCNEDDCWPDCKHLSNGFFASTPQNIIIERLLKEDKLKKIDFYSDKINATTGPIYFRSGIYDYNEIKILPTESIYPYINWNSKYRKSKFDLCISSSIKNLNINHSKSEIKIINFNNKNYYMLFPCDKYPKSLAVTHFVFGGTWK